METQIIAEPVNKTPGVDYQKITPFLWFDNEAEEAVKFYTSVFNNSKIRIVTHYEGEGANAMGKEDGSVMTLSFLIEGQEFVAINAGPLFKINPSISFFVNCDKAEEIDRLWAKLSDGGEVFMELNKYPFSEKYGWVKDKYGVSWQLILPGRAQKIAPCLMFSGDQHRKAEEAIRFYTSVFSNSEIIQLERYTAEQGPEGAIIHAKFTLNGQEFVAMDSHTPLPYNFNPGISLVVNCENQAEIDYYWDKLSEGGFEGAQQCGWLSDKYGVSWQVVPVNLGELLSDPDSAKSARAMQAMLQMKKIDIRTLQQAHDLQ
ncbi:MAG TPA: VOC family protein [Prolixibacteraceae bacterium]|jgi:predicted 3-demethylubiquinone-9 3-methyltransferase (glyoxalase superfamily)